MNDAHHYVITQRGNEVAFAAPSSSLSAIAEVLPRRVYRWGVDGPWLLAWGSSSARTDDFNPPAPATTTFKHWFRRELLGISDL